MRFRPANISVINRRASHWAVIGPAVQISCSKLTSRNMFPLRRPSTSMAFRYALRVWSLLIWALKNSRTRLAAL
jgi:hypothetical protein